MIRLRYAFAWAAIGWLGVALAVILSLWPRGAPLQFRDLDKLEHLIGYFLLTFWFVGLYPRGRYPQLALGAFLLGIGIELLQGLAPTRTMELSDALVDGAGVVVALLAAYLGAGGWAARVERLLGVSVA